MITAYDVKRDARGWTVFDRRTGQIVVLARAPQCGLTWIEADELADRLNHRNIDGDRSILQ